MYLQRLRGASRACLPALLLLASGLALSACVGVFASGSPSRAGTVTTLPAAVAATAPAPAVALATSTVTAPVTGTVVASTPTEAAASPPVRIIIPDLKIDVPVQLMTWQNVRTASGLHTEWDIPKNAAGWAQGSAAPGQPDNMVVSGHNNIYGRVFMNISLAWPNSGTHAVDASTDGADILNGRLIDVYTADGKRYQYLISAFYRVRDANVPLPQRKANARFIAPTNQPQLTITTCWPPWGNIDRLIIVAQPRS